MKSTIHASNMNTESKKMKKNNKKSIVKLTGSKDSNYVIKIEGSDDYYDDMVATHLELIQLRDILNKKIK